MDERLRLLELQSSWTPPAELSGARPRQVCLTGAGKAVLGLAVALLAGALAAGLALGVVGRREAEERRILAEQGLDTEARITRLWRSRGDDKQPWVAYQFTVQGREHESRAKAPLRIWRELETGAGLPVRYLPGRPEVNHPRAWARKIMPAGLPYIVAAVLAAFAGLATLALRGQRRLLAEGRTAPAVVTRHTKAKDGQTPHYEFPLLSGAIRQGKGGPSKKPPAVGSVIAVLYDPEHPRRNAPYPLSLVKPA